MRLTIFILGILLLSSCKKEKPDVDYSEIETVIKSNIITFNNSTIPEELIDDVKNKRVLIIGESHYIQEHHKFVYLLMDKLSYHGFNILLNEHNNSFSWLAEDYTNSNIDTLPTKMYYFDACLLNTIRSHNTLFDNKISYKYFDINHWSTDFKTSIIELEKILGEQDIFINIKNTNYGTDSYKSELNNLKNNLIINSNLYHNNWGITWYDRIFNMVDIESKSIGLDINSDINDINTREEIMISLIEKELNNPSNKILINCGASHAQKTAYENSNMDRLGVYLASKYNNEVYSIKIYGLSGEFKSNYAKPTENFNLCSNTSTNDFSNIICRNSDERFTYLKLDDPHFDNEKIKITFPPNSTYFLSPYNHFDAYISIPNVSIIESFNKYEL